MSGAPSGLRILMVSAHYPPALNGFAIQCHDTSNMLAACGYDVRVLTSAAGAGQDETGARRIGRLGSASPEGHTSVHPRYLLRQLARRRIYRANYRECLAAVDTFAPDVAVVWQFDSVGIGLVHAFRTRGVPVVFNVEDYSLSTVVGLLRRHPIRLIDHIRRWIYNVRVAELDLSNLMLVSGELRAWYAAEGFPTGDMTVVHNGIAAAQIVPAPPPTGSGTRLLFVGRLHPSKGLLLVIDALAHANRGRPVALTLDLIGTGDPQYEAQMADRISSLGLSAHVRFLGHLDRTEIISKYRDYDALLFPSIWVEPFGLVVIEAMSQGVPVIALDRGGPREIITHMVDGLLVPGEDPVDFADAMSRLADSGALRQQLAAAAIRAVADRFTLERHTALTETILREVVARHQRHDATGSRRAS